MALCSMYVRRNKPFPSWAGKAPLLQHHCIAHTEHKRARECDVCLRSSRSTRMAKANPQLLLSGVEVEVAAIVTILINQQMALLF